MNKTYVLILIILLIAIGGVGYLYATKPSAAPATQTAVIQQTVQTAPASVTYQYECDEHVAFALTPSSDMTSLHVAPSGSGAYPPSSTLMKVATTSGVRYAGGSVVLSAKGQTVILGEGDSAINCSPVATPGQAALNFGN